MTRSSTAVTLGRGRALVVCWVIAAVGAGVWACSINDVPASPPADASTNDGTPGLDAPVGQDSSANDGSAPADADGVPVDAGLDVGNGFVQVSAFDHACAVMGDGKVACWGSNNYGQCGSGSDAGVLYAPEYVKGITNAKQVSVNLRYSCAVLTDGTMKCWGNLLYLNQFETVPGADGGVQSGIEKASVGFKLGSFTAMKTTTGDALCMGYDELGACSTGAPYFAKNAVPMLSAPAQPFVNVKDVAVGTAGNSCVVASDGTVHCSGNGPRADNLPGGVMLAATAKINSTTDFTGAAEVSVAYQHACAVSADRLKVNCWGANFAGQLGVTGTGDYPPYVQAPVNGITGKVVNLSAAGGFDAPFSCVSLDDGTAQCWGVGTSGQLGNGSNASSSSATKVVGLPSGKLVRSISAGGYYTCVTMKDGTAYCFGKGDTGQLGDGQGKQSFVPVQVKMPL